MNRLFLAAVLLPMLLASCNTDQSEDTVETLTGSFLDLGISGLSYQTDTLSGRLNDGQYEYLAGEEVSILFKGESLFEFDAADGFSFSDLTDEFPATEDDLYSAWYGDDDFESFQVLLNLVQLLFNLDADSNHANGIDVSSIDMSGSLSTDIDLTVSAEEFYETTLIELASELGTTRSVTPMYSVWNLYDIAGKSLPIYQRATLSITEDDSTDVTYYDYSIEGYDEFETEYSSSQIIVGYSEFTNDDMGRMTAFTDYFLDDSGNSTGTRSKANSYNDLGQLVEVIVEQDYTGDGTLNYSSLEEYTYNSEGEPSAYIYSHDNDYDSVFDSVESATYDYDENGFLTTEVRSQDSDNDGDADKIYTESYEYDADGLVTEFRTETDSDADGSHDEYRVETTTYNDAGLVLSEILIDYDSDTDEKGFNVSEMNTYDDSDNRTQYSYVSDYDGDDVLDYYYVVDYEYYEDGEVEVKTSSYYNDGSTLSKVTRSVYDGTGTENYRNYVIYTDSDGNGTEDSSKSYVYTLDDEGNLTILNLLTDSDNDGSTDSTKTYDYTYEYFDNGSAIQLYNINVNW
jgi:hypothetical protein